MASKWVSYIKGRIKRNKNFVGFVGGPTGSGKSWTCLSIAEKIDPKFNLDQCVFTPLELMKIVNSNKLKPGSVIVFEEAGVALSNRNWQGLINKVMNHLIQTFRHKRLIVLMNSPYMDFIDKATRKLFHAEFKVESINVSAQKTIIVPKLIQYNDKKDKFYYKYLRVTVPGKGLQKVQRWAVSKPSKELREGYEKRKNSYTKGLNEEIMLQLLNKEKEDKPKQEWHCQECGYDWQPRTKEPAYCPRCRKKGVCVPKASQSN